MEHFVKKIYRLTYSKKKEKSSPRIATLKLKATPVKGKSNTINNIKGQQPITKFLELKLKDQDTLVVCTNGSETRRKTLSNLCSPGSNFCQNLVGEKTTEEAITNTALSNTADGRDGDNTET